MTEHVFFGNNLKKAAFSFLILLFSLSVNAQCSLTGWSKIGLGEQFSIALKQDRTIWMWGLNAYGLIGDGTGSVTTLPHPVQIGTANDWTDISVDNLSVLAKKSNGDL